jgi:signal peptidase I
VASSSKPKSAGGSLVELVVIVVVALGLALGIQAFLVKPYRIPSESMVPTLEVNQRVLVNRIGNNFGDPQIGDVMVFHPPTGAVGAPGVRRSRSTANQICPRPTRERADVNFIKRVVAGTGDKLRIEGRQGDRQRQDAQRVLRPVVARPTEDGCTYAGEITIPPDHWFMMGDKPQRPARDSRFWGPVPREWFIGGAFATYWTSGQGRPALTGRNVRAFPRDLAGRSGTLVAVVAATVSRLPALRAPTGASLLHARRRLEHRFGRGADEAGRGCLAATGRGAGGALRTSERFQPAPTSRALGGLNDSKQHSPRRPRRSSIRVFRCASPRGRRSFALPRAGHRLRAACTARTRRSARRARARRPARRVLP